MRKLFKNINILKKLNLQREKFFFNLKNYKFLKNYNKKKFEEEQNLIFYEKKLNRIEAINKVDLIKNKYSFLKQEMSSEHEIIFSALSLKKDFHKILEIGTFNGANSFLLSKLFPKASILTIDLCDNDNLFKKSYNRSQNDKLIEFINKRNLILNKSDNIIFKQMNSINLFSKNEKYDLIWIDGAHGYPMVSIDIMNALKLTTPNSIIMCDDIIIQKPKKQDSLYVSLAAFETLKILKNEGIIDLTLFYKRLDSLNNANPKTRKYIAYFTLKK